MALKIEPLRKSTPESRKCFENDLKKAFENAKDEADGKNKIFRDFARFFQNSSITYDSFLAFFLLYKKTIYYVGVNTAPQPIHGFPDLLNTCRFVLPETCFQYQKDFWESFKEYMIAFFNGNLRKGQCSPISAYHYYWTCYFERNYVNSARIPQELRSTYQYNGHLLSYIPQTSTAKYLTKDTFYGLLPIHPGRKLGKKMYDSLYNMSSTSKPFIPAHQDLSSSLSLSDYQPSEVCINVIQQLCPDNSSLQDLATLFEQLSSKEECTKIIIMRLPNKSDRAKSVEMLDLLCQHIYKLASYKAPSLRTLIHNKNLEPYINYEFTPFLCTILNHSQVGQIDETAHRKLTKLFFGKRITFFDSFLGSVQFYNHTPTIYVAYSDAQAEKTRNAFPSITLKLGAFDKLKREDILSLSWSDTNFLRLVLPTLFQEEKKQEAANDVIRQVKYFMKTYTQKRGDSFIYADDLYDVYTKYMAKQSYLEPLTPINFGKKIRFLYSYEYYKPHKSRNTPNKYAYKGVALRTNKIQELEEKPLYKESKLSIPELIDLLLKRRVISDSSGKDVKIDVKT